MARKLFIARLGAGSITVALCAALPGCNLAIIPTEICTSNPSSRGMSTVTCVPIDASSDSARDTNSDSARDSSDAPAADSAGDHP